MNKYMIQFTWFYDRESFEEVVSIPADSLSGAVEKVLSGWGSDVEVTYHELQVYRTPKPS